MRLTAWLCEIARSDASDIDAALDAAHKAKDAWGRTSVAERALIRQYEDDIAQLLDGLTADTLPLAVEIASLPEEIRGYGHIKAWSMNKAAEKRKALLARWSGLPKGTERAA